MKYLLLLPFLMLRALPSVSQDTAVQRLELKRLQLENTYRTVGQFDPVTGVATVYDNGKMGFIDTSGKIILPLGEYVTYDFSGERGVWKSKGIIRTVDKYGKVVDVFPALESMLPQRDGLFMVSQKTKQPGRYGIMNAAGKIIIPCNYSGIDKISAKYYKVIDNGIGSGIITSKGDTVIPLRYIIDYIDTATLEFIGYRADTGYAVFNADGSVKKYLAKRMFMETAHIEGNVFTERDGVIVIKDRFSDDSARYALVNTRFDTIVPAGKYFHLSDINEGLIKFSDSVSTGKDGRRTNPYQYVRCGFLNTKGEVVIPSKFDFAHYFTEGLSGVRVKGKWGFIDKKGQMVIALKFDYVLPFKNGFARVKVKGRYYVINKTGSTVMETKPW